MQSLYPFFFSLLCIIFAQTMDQGKYPYFYVFFNMQGSDMILCNLSLQFFFFFFFNFYVSFQHKSWSRVSICTFMSFSTCKEVICFYAISLSCWFVCVCVCVFSLLCVIFAQTMEQGKYPYFYVFFNMQVSNMLLCNLSILFYLFIYFFHFFVSFSHRPWNKVSICTFMSFST